MSRASVIALLVGVIALAPLSAHAAPELAASAADVEAEPAATPAATPLTLKSDPAAASPRSSSDLGLVTKIGACALILGAAAWVFIRRRSATKTDPAAKGALSLVSRLPLGARLEVCVVEVEGQRLVLGVTPQSISTLSVTGLDSALMDGDPVAAEPSVPEARVRPAQERPARAPDRAEPPLEIDEPRRSWRETNQTGVQRITKAPPEALLRLFERNRSVTQSGASAVDSEYEHDEEPPRASHRPAEPSDRPEPRRTRQETPRPRSAQAQPTLEGQARGLASLRAKR